MLKRLICVIICLLITLSAGSADLKASSITGRTYYVSVNGNDIKGVGSKEAPWRTLSRAVPKMKPGDTCIIRQGTYRETLTMQISGEAGKPIKFMAFPGEKVTICGTENINGWSLYSGNIYKTNLSWDLNHDNQFFANGQILWEARWPNLSEFSMEGFQKSMAKVVEGTADSITDPSLAQKDNYWMGATLWCRSSPNSKGLGAWLAQSSRVTASDSQKNTISFNPFRESYYPAYPSKNNDYYLSGLLSLLDSPREWHVDRKNKVVYLISPDGKKPTGIEMKKRKYVIDLSNKSYIEISGINTFAGTINMMGSSHCLLEGMDMKWLNYSNDCTLGYDSQLNNGIWISGDYNEIRNCTIAYTTGAAIKISGNSNRIVNNLIHDIDYSSSYGAPINLSGNRNLISHNTICNTGRFCIQLGGIENIVQFNDMSKFMMLSSDGSAVYSFGIDGGNTRIHHNKIHDSNGFCASGIYLDNFSRNFIVDHNIIYNLEAYPFQFNTPQNYNQIYNNTSYNTKPSVLYWGESPYSEEWYGNRMENNIFFNEFNYTSARDEYAFDHNLVSCVDAGYIDSAAGNFHLNPGSESIDAGIAIPGITDGYKDSAPDLGAYEYGGDDWTAGCNFKNPPIPEYKMTDTPYSNRLRNSGFEYGYVTFRGTNYVSGISDWICTGQKTASLVDVDESPDLSMAWIKRGVDSKLILGGGIDGVEQVISGLKPNTKYRLAGWTYVDSNESISFGVCNYGGETKKISNSQQTYRKDIIEFTTGKGNTSATIFIIKESITTGHAYADDFGVVERN